MYTQCPECLSVFSLDAATLTQAHGHVICGHCEAGFDSFATLASQLPPEPFRELPINQQAMLPPRIELVVYRPHDEPPAVIVSESPAPLDAEDFSQLVFAPKFVREQAGGPRMRRQQRRGKRRAGGRHGLWVLLCSVLALLLGAQLAWAERSVLIRDPLVGHWLRNTCHLLGCQLPLVAAPQLLQLLDSNVQAHPGVPHALMISASVRNDAAFAQPYPVLGITLSDAQGQRLAMRRLQPRDYLDDPAALARGLAPGATTVLLLEVNDPGDKAVAFEFNFQ